MLKLTHLLPNKMPYTTFWWSEKSNSTKAFVWNKGYNNMDKMIYISLEVYLTILMLHKVVSFLFHDITIRDLQLTLDR